MPEITTEKDMKSDFKDLVAFMREFEERRHRPLAEFEEQRRLSFAEFEEQRRLSFAEEDKKRKEFEEQRRLSSAEEDKKRKEFEEYMQSLLADIGQKQREAAEQAKETDKRLVYLEKMVDRVTGNVGGLNRSLGELIETLIAARLWEKFVEYDLKRSYQRLPIYDDKNIKKTDIDILLVNTGMCMAVEVKRELDKKKEVDEHLKRMRLIRQYPPEQVLGKQLLGAMAGGIVDTDVKDYAYECGFYVLELTGESVQLIPPPSGFVPKKW